MIYIYFFRRAIEFFCKIQLKSLRPKHNFFNGRWLAGSCSAAMPCTYARQPTTNGGTWKKIITLNP